MDLHMKRSNIFRREAIKMEVPLINLDNEG
jgi:hypothetical protein